MPARLLVRKIREVLRLKHEHGLSHRAIARACAVGVGTVTLYLQRTVQEGLGWPLPAELDDAALEARLFRREAPVHDRVRPDCAYIHRELKRDGVTLQLLCRRMSDTDCDGDYRGPKQTPHPQPPSRTPVGATLSMNGPLLRPRLFRAPASAATAVATACFRAPCGVPFRSRRARVRPAATAATVVLLHRPSPATP